jgi:galactose mutarotase-like enzyme
MFMAWQNRRTKDAMVKFHELSAGAMHARISECGAELQDLRLDDWDLLWTPDVSIWPETAPFLFPVIGRTSSDSIKVDGQAYPMPMHGLKPSQKARMPAHWNSFRMRRPGVTIPINSRCG